MPTAKIGQLVIQNGAKLLKYQETRGAVVRLQDGRRVDITIDADVVTLRRTRGFFDLFLDVKLIGSWNVASIHARQPDGTPFPPQARNAVLLDILIKRIVHSQSLRDVHVKASTGALDPIEEAEAQLESTAKRP